MAIAAIPIAMGVMGGVMSVMSAKSAASGYASQANEYKQQAMLTELQAKEDTATRLDNLTRALGSNHAAAGAANVAIDSESMAAIDQYDMGTVGSQIGANMVTAKITEQRDIGAGIQDLQSASSATTQGWMGAGMSLFTGGLGAAKLTGVGMPSAVT